MQNGTNEQALAAQVLPPCGAERPTSVSEPWSGDGQRYCLELVFEDPRYGEIAFTTLEAGTDGTLYATLPTHGQVAAFQDTTGDGLPDAPEMIAEDLTRPNGLALHNNTLYISGGANLYALDTGSGQLSTLVSDLPAGPTGYWAGDVAVGNNERLYVAIGGDPACTPGRGAIHSFALDGTDQQIVARGLHAPSGIVFIDDALWTVDSAAGHLIQIQPGTDYGACSGASYTPQYEFPHESAPLGLAYYRDTTFPDFTNQFLVVLQGNRDVIITGYELAAVNPQTQTSDHIVPRIDPQRDLSRQKMHIQGSGFWPHHVYGVAVDENGWIFISSGGGRIHALRPI